MGSRDFDFGRGFGVLSLGASLLASFPSGAIELADGRVEIHGAYEMQFRTLNQDFRHEWDLSQWKHILQLEAEVTLFDEPISIFDDASVFFRIEASYDCVWRRGCGVFPSADTYGDRAKGIPSRYRDGKRNGFVGDDPLLNPVNPGDPYHQTPAANLFLEDADPATPDGPGRFLPFDTPRERTSRLVGIADTPPFEILGPNFSFNTAFAPLLDYRFAIKQDAFTTSGGDASGADATILMWRPKDRITNVGLLASVANQSSPGLPFRPAVPAGGIQYTDSTRVGRGLFNPSAAFRRLDAKHNLDRYDQNFTQSELEWNFGASQDEYVLREAYVDLNLFDSRLFLRLGKQTIIWGKTELFRNMDQFNPSDLALVTLPDLEQSRIPLWSMRAIWSFWNVGPLDDVRLEIAWMMDDFEPHDVGRCGEPYAPLPVCDKSFGVFEHAVLGIGLAGERRPPNWWEDLSGVEIGARLEFRWDRFSFAITDFWHYEDTALPRIFNRYQRRVDPDSGRPLAALAPPDARCETGAERWCLRPGASGENNALAHSPQNRQIYDVICASSVAFFTLDPSVCALTITNSRAKTQLATLPDFATLLQAVQLRHIISATAAGNTDASGILAGLAGSPFAVTPLNFDACDAFLADCATPAPLPAPFLPGIANVNQSFANDSPFTVQSAPAVGNVGRGLRDVLTVQQEALLGCGPYFGSDCDRDGIDLFNAEASVVFQAWPGRTPGSPTATRFVNGQTIILPGARGPGDPGYTPLVDGTPPAGLNPVTGLPYRSELEAFSVNALQFVVALDVGTGVPLPCFFPDVAPPGGTVDPTAPINCPTVQDFFSVTQVTRPELRAGGNGAYGRRDFAWAAAGEVVLEYEKVNTLGFAVDFAEDVTATNWGVEFTWTASKDFVNSEVPSLRSDSDLLALTVSIDRPTFIRFLNRERTFFFNMQWFMEYIPDYVGRGPDDRHRGFAVDGPFTALGVFTVETGFLQDRLVPSATFVYDVKSESGAVALDLRYRYTANFTVTIGMSHFYGPGAAWRIPIGLGAAGESNQTYRSERFTRLNAVREKDELWVIFRRTF